MISLHQQKHHLGMKNFFLRGLVGFWANNDAMVTDCSPNGNSQKMII